MTFTYMDIRLFPTDNYCLHLPSKCQGWAEVANLDNIVSIMTHSQMVHYTQSTAIKIHNLTCILCICIIESMCPVQQVHEEFKRGSVC